MASFSTRFLCLNLVFLVHAVSIYLRPLFSFISNFIFRLQGDGSDLLDKNGEKITFIETEAESFAENDATEFRDFDEDGAMEEEKTENYLKFKFPTYEEFSQTREKTGKTLNSEVVPSVSASKYEFASGKNSVSAVIEKMETFLMKEIETDNCVDCLSAGDLGEVSVESGFVHEKGKENLEENEKVEAIDFVEKSEEKAQTVESSHVLIDEQMHSDEDSRIIDSDSESTSFEHIRSAMNRLMDSYSDGFLSDGDFGEEFDMDDENEGLESELSAFEENHDLSDEDSNIMEDKQKLEESNSQDGNGLNSDFLQDKDFNEDIDNINDAEFITKGDDSEKSRLKDSDNGDANELESLWEHQELIEQLKMELKKVRATGLPTILEESETSPRISGDLKPWKIDEFQREDSIGELQKIYKSYRERMRKFDIINYQKMYAMGFLQLKDPLQSISKQKCSPPTLKSLVSQNLWLFKHKIHGSDPMKKFIAELQGDLEMVYLGQTCLSWEFLHWQYEKAWDLWDSDPRGRRRYNEVAGEFQQFQVLVQRFVEDEPFQGPRVQNYVKTRCAVRNLLQVPVIREDNLKEKRKARNIESDECVITSEMLVEIVEESIRIFWRFVRADKDCNVASINSHKKMPELATPEDLSLLVEIKKNLQKKERKLKDVLRSENCILRKFRRCSEDDSDQVLYFFSQVDMKLVARVLNMSKITREQLIWCHNKLGRISFVNRKIHVEPAFLLFPS